MKKITCICLSFIIVLMSCVSLAANFSDISGHWAESYITALTDEKIISGYPDGTYKPEGTLTYGEFFKLIVTASLPEANFSILLTDYTHWAGPYAQVLKNYKIITDDSFSESMFDMPIPRIEVVRVLGLCDIKICGHAQNYKEYDFSDVKDLNSEQSVLLGHAVATGVIAGDPEGTFRPNDNLKRSEVAKIIYVYRSL